MRDFYTEELVEERKGNDKDIRWDGVETRGWEKKMRKKNWNEKMTKKRVWWDFFLVTIIIVHNKLKIKYITIAVVGTSKGN